MVVVAAPIIVGALGGTVVACAVVDVGLFALGAAGGVTTILGTVNAAQHHDWDTVAENAGGLVGGGLVGGFGGGRSLGGMDGKPSPAPRMTSIKQMLEYEDANKYDRSLGPAWPKWYGSKPTPASGGGVITLAGGGAASLPGLLH